MKKTLLALVAIVSAFIITVPVMAEEPLTPASHQGVTVVDNDWVKTNHGKMKVFDVRKKAEYVEAHLPGAIFVPYDEKSEKVADFDAKKDNLDLSKFPADKNDPVIVYCNGPRCWKSYKASVLLVKAGHKKVYWYRDGFPGWKSKGYPVE
jgi:rhodanese-related sulfurtransferase